MSSSTSSNPSLADLYIDPPTPSSPGGDLPAFITRPLVIPPVPDTDLPRLWSVVPRPLTNTQSRPCRCVGPSTSARANWMPVVTLPPIPRPLGATPVLPPVSAAKQLSRAAGLLQETWFLYQEAINVWSYSRVEWSSDRKVLRLHSYDGPSIHPGTPRRAIPNHLGLSRSEKMSIFSFLNCRVSVAMLHEMAKWWLQELGDIKEVEAKPKDQPFIMEEAYHRTRRVYSNKPHSHCFWKVDLHEDSTQWAVDTTGAQYGWFDPVKPWSRWMIERSESDIEWKEYRNGRARGDSRIRDVMDLWLHEFMHTFDDIMVRYFWRNDYRASTILQFRAEEDFAIARANYLDQVKEGLDMAARVADERCAGGAVELGQCSCHAMRFAEN